MPTDIRPAGVKTAAKSKILIATSIADPAAPTVAEVNAALAIEYYLVPGAWSPTASDEVETDTRYGDDEVFGSFGRATWTIPDITYIFDPQGTGTENGNKAFGALKRGFNVFALERPGLAVTAAVAAAQKINVFPIECGTQRQTPIGDATGGGTSSKFTITQSLQPSGPVKQWVAIVAGS